MRTTWMNKLNKTAFLSMLCVFAFPVLAVNNDIICIEAENYFDGPANTVEALGFKPTSSGRANLYGYQFGRPGRITRYIVEVDDDYDNAVLSMRYSRKHWYSSQKNAELKLTLASLDTLLTRQEVLPETGGWATNNPENWAMADIELGPLAEGIYSLQLESLTERDGDFNIDFLLIRDTANLQDFSGMQSCDRLHVSSERYVGFTVDKKIVSDASSIRVELPVYSFKGKYAPEMAVYLIDNKTGQTKIIYDFPGKGSNAKAKSMTACFIAEEFEELADGVYTLRGEYADSPAMDIEILVLSEFAKKLPKQIEKLQFFYDDKIASGKNSKAQRYAADYLYAIEYLKQGLEKIADDKIKVRDITNLKNTIAQYELTSELLEKNYAPYAQRRGDLRLAVNLERADSHAGFRIFLPENYSHAAELPCIFAVDNYEDAYLNMADGLLMKLANEKGFAVIASSGLDGFWGDNLSRLLGIFDAATKRFPGIDRNNIFALGSSHNGFRVYSLSVDRPDLFSAIACINGCGDRIVTDNTYSWRNKISALPVMIIQGQLDNMTPTNWARIIARGHKRRDLPCELREYPLNGMHIEKHADEYFPVILEFFDRYRSKAE